MTPASSSAALTPQQHVEQQCALRGEAAVATTCIRLLRGHDVAPDDVIGLVGAPARKFFDGGEHDDGYWLRVWGARGLLWSWDPRATEAIRVGLHDDHWRVREMSAKVVARHLLDDLFDDVATCREDAVPRVRAAAARAVARITSAGA
jgi:hypothetical protein